MSFADFLGNEPIRARLKAALRNDRLPHALLFAGPEGVGKKRLALELAKVLNCRMASAEEPCDRCVSCQKIAKGLHTDVQIIMPVDSAFIRIEQLRRLAEEARFRPFEGLRRIFILENADRMTEEAANAALKTLEEPPDTSHFILVTTTPQTLLPTIRSRCQLMAFAPVPIPLITRWLQTQNKYPDADDAELAARLSLGSIGRALSMDLAAYKEMRNDAFLAAENVFVLKSFMEINKSAQKRTKDRKEFESYLDTLLLMLRDALVFKHLQNTELVINIDLRDGLKRLARHSTFERLSLIIEQITALRRALDRNLNRQLALESVLLNMSQAP